MDRTVIAKILAGSIAGMLWPHLAVGQAGPPEAGSSSAGNGPRIATATEPALLLSERFDPFTSYQVDLKVDLKGQLSVPSGNGHPERLLAMTGRSQLKYDERVLPSDRDGSARTARIYREIQLRRSVDDRDQEATIRPEVRRLIILRSASGKKAPFSPDGPLLWAEIDLVRADLFIPALVRGFLPRQPVAVGDRWTVHADAVMELTDFDPIQEGQLIATYLASVNIDNRRYAKIAFEGTVRGIGTDGPSQNRLEGIAYFDREAERLTYLNLRGRHELQDASGKTHGWIEGRLVMTRYGVARIAELSDSALPAAAIAPSVENTQLLYDNRELGVRFLYSRRWRVSRVQGQQITLEEPQGSGILMTLETVDTIPSPEQYLGESRGYLLKRKWNITSIEPPRRWSREIHRFAINAQEDQRPVRMEYAVYAGSEGGLLLAARLSGADLQELQTDLERLLKSLTVRKPIKE